MHPATKRVGALSELACEGNGEIPFRAVPLEQDSVSRFQFRVRVWVVKAECSMASVGVLLAYPHRSF